MLYSRSHVSPQLKRSRGRRTRKDQFSLGCQSAMNFKLFCQNARQRPAHGSQPSCFNHLLHSHTANHLLVSLFFCPPWPALYRTFLRRGRRRRSAYLIGFYRLPPCRNFRRFFCRLQPHAQLTVCLHNSSSKQRPARHLTKSTAEASMIMNFCHANVGHQNTIHQGVPVFGQPLHIQKLLLAARGQVLLSGMTLNARLQLSRLQNTPTSSSYVLHTRPCFVSVHFRLRARNTDRPF